MSAKTLVWDAYMAAWAAVLVWGPLIALHGYRQWWVVLFYAEIAVAAIFGGIGHYRVARRNRKSSTHAGPQTRMESTPPSAISPT